ncbi:ubiquitin carboxyl-terminal hydrolase 8 isoform X1 [Calliphora vicina]|uniref:ubiquitin carboxyl-terminal hydrolase 8 isoform X1 n=1 Tax=Calliphora vicina TaxID=7373 RepID=UPI00325BEE6F
MSIKKDLYYCKNIDDLEKCSEIPDVRQRKMHYLLETAKKLNAEAEKYYRKGDEELAYVFYTKYFNLLNSIYKKPDYQENKPLIRQMLGDNRSNKMTMDRLEALTMSLNERYECLNAKLKAKTVAKSATPPSSNEQYAMVSNDRSRSNSPKISNIDIAFMRLMSCQQLFESMKLQNVLVIDCRSAEDYKSSHLQYNLTLNIPEEIIQAGMSAGKLQDKLDNESKKLWSARAVKNEVVLIDWNCSEPNPSEDRPIAILLDILQNWDPDVTYRSSIKILEGGYEYFLLMYPTCCTNPMVQAPSVPQNDLNLIDDIEYPSVFDIQMKDEIILNISDTTNAAKSPPPMISRPVIDRASKQAAIKTYDDKQKDIVEIVKDQTTLLEKAKENDEELQKVAKQLDNIYDKKQLTASEQQLLYNMMQLESAAEDFKLENMRLREELEEYKRREKEEKVNIPPQLKVEVEKTTKEIEAKIEERQRLDEKLEREKQQRALQLAIARENKRHLNAKLIEAEKRHTELEVEFDNSDYELEDKPLEEPEKFIPKPNIPQFDRSVKPQLTARVSPPQSPNIYALQRQRDFSPVSGTTGRGLTGLKNLGNTCYMNSIIQCLSNTPQLAEYCITDKYKNYISRNNKTKGQIVEEVAALIKVLWNGNYKCVASKDLRYVIGQYQKMFRGIEQQDSHEFLTILMDWLHSDLQTLTQPEYLREPMTASDKAWLDFTKSKESLILHLFYGQIKSIVKCTTCDKESATYECFSNLSLELPENNNVCHLSQCLDMYFSGERIHGWNCPGCKQKREAIKKLNISKLPPVLVIHLKRFYADTDSITPSYKKKQNYLRFPLENLDTSPYITISESRRNTTKSYELYAVSNHYGSMESGHYTAFCKSGTYGRWFKYDDQVVTPLDASNVVSSAAYILFYTRLQPSQYISQTCRL